MGRLTSAMPVVVEPGAGVGEMTDRALLEVVLGSPPEAKPCTRRGADRLEWLRPAVSRLADSDRRVAVWEEMRARRLCAGCPVTGECLELALRGEPVEGVQGGATERSRRTLRRRRAVQRGRLRAGPVVGQGVNKPRRCWEHRPGRDIEPLGGVIDAGRGYQCG